MVNGEIFLFLQHLMSMRVAEKQVHLLCTKDVPYSGKACKA